MFNNVIHFLYKICVTLYDILRSLPIKYLPDFIRSIVAKYFRSPWFRNLKGYLVTAQSRRPLAPELRQWSCPCSAYVTTTGHACDNILMESRYVVICLLLLQESNSKTKNTQLSDIHMSVQRNIISNYNFSGFIYFYRHSTCFRRFLRPSSGAHNCTYSFRYCQPIPEAVCTVVCFWWWAEKPPETCRAFVKINKSRNVASCWL